MDRSFRDLAQLMVRCAVVTLVVAGAVGAAAYALSGRRSSVYESVSRVAFSREQRYEYRDGERDRLVSLLNTDDVAAQTRARSAKSVTYVVPDRQSFIDITVRSYFQVEASRTAKYLATTLVDRNRAEVIAPKQAQSDQLQATSVQREARIAELTTQLGEIAKEEAAAESGRYTGTNAETYAKTIAALDAQRRYQDAFQERSTLIGERLNTQQQIDALSRDIKLLTPDIQVVRPATDPAMVVSPNPERDAAIAAILAGAAAFVLVLGLDSRRRVALSRQSVTPSAMQVA
jgi:hypothetical protein